MSLHLFLIIFAGICIKKGTSLYLFNRLNITQVMMIIKKKATLNFLYEISHIYKSALYFFCLISKLHVGFSIPSFVRVSINFFMFTIINDFQI